MSKFRFAAATAVVLALAFIAGVYALFRLRVEAADAYPPYSTMRADPLGAKALYESLLLQPGLTVTRNMRPLSGLGGHDTTLFLLGVDEWFADSTDVDRMARSGGRLVIAFVPQRPRLASEVEMERQLIGDKKGVETRHIPTLLEKLGVSPITETEKRRTDWSPDPPRYTALWFGKLAPEWTVKKTYQNHPVWIERAWLNGSVVLLADSWMLSNEALAHEPDAGGVAELVGGSHHVVFDEQHLGLTEGGSVAGLMRRYRLHGLIAALLVLAGLYIWKNSSSFLPRVTPTTSDAASGFSAASGLVTLLERSVPPPQLLDICIAEYQSTAGRALAEEPRRKLEETLNQTGLAADPAHGYEHIRQALEEIRHPWKKTSSN